MFPFPRGAPFMLLLIVLRLVLPDRAHDVITTKLTYSRDISRIFLKRCAACQHRQRLDTIDFLS